MRRSNSCSKLSYYDKLGIRDGRNPEPKITRNASSLTMLSSLANTTFEKLKGGDKLLPIGSWGDDDVPLRLFFVASLKA